MYRNSQKCENATEQRSFNVRFLRSLRYVDSFINDFFFKCLYKFENIFWCNNVLSFYLKWNFLKSQVFPIRIRI